MQNVINDLFFLVFKIILFFISYILVIVINSFSWYNSDIL